MRSSFLEFHIASTGLMASRNGTRTTAHNIANVNTPGFSRQVAVMRASQPLPTNNRTGMIGTGAELAGIHQIRSIPLDQRYWNERHILGMHSTRAAQLTLVEARFGELEGLGLTGNFERFFDSLQYLSTNVTNATVRNNFSHAVNTLAHSMNDKAIAMRRQQQDINQEIGNVVSIINSKGNQIADLNRQIQRAEVRGDRANDLRDQRAVLVDELSILVNTDVIETTLPNGRDELTVWINGREFVRGDRVHQLETVARNVPLHIGDAPGLFDLTLAGVAFRVDNRGFSGELRGLFETRDGNSMRDGVGGDLVTNPRLPYDSLARPLAFKGIPYYLARMHLMLQTVANAFNFGIDHLRDPIPEMVDENGVTRGHMNGYRVDGTNSNGTPLFVPDGWAERSTPGFSPPYWDSMFVSGAGGDVVYMQGQTGPPPVLGQFFEVPERQAFAAGNADHVARWESVSPGVAFDAANSDHVDLWNRVGYVVPFDYTNPAHINSWLQHGASSFNFSLNPDIFNDNSLLSTSLNNHGTGGVDDNSLIMGFVAIRNYESLFREGTINDFINSVAAELGMDLMDAETFALSQSRVVEIVQNQRLQIKGVDYDEEVMNLIFFQHHFQASSRLISVIDNIYDTLINRMGV
ncbi:MAG: flagellar hook-associated protein FlgK [Defluviitaleaceae bacterium]|nr:flagellar hook-associated protein FlgK [Defluviitaleaceae bacterium]